MEPKDVQHFYLGCEVMTKRGKGLLVSVAWEDLDCVVRIKNDDEESGFYGQYEDFDFSLHHIKPILRPLPSITDKEIDEIASILLGKETHCYEKWRAKEGDCIIAEWKKEKPLLHAETYDSLTMGMLIRADFTIDHQWNYHNAKGTGVTHEPLPNHNKITAYLLSKGFDVFSLIESGKAIDATTLTQQQ